MTLSKDKIVTLIRNLFSFFLIYIGIQFLAAIIVMPLMLLLDFLLNQNLFSEGTNNLYYLIAGCLAQILSIYFFYKLYKKKDFNLTKIHPNISLKAFGKYALISLGASGISALWIFLVQFLSNYFPFIKNSLESYIQHVSIYSENSILSFVSVVILAPIAEEIIFRGVIFNEAAKYKGGTFPIIISALLFGLAHGEPVQIVYTFISGLILGFIYSKTHSLPIVMFLHMVNNLLSTFPDSLAIPINIIQVICIIPMIYFLVKLYKGDIPEQVLNKTH